MSVCINMVRRKNIDVQKGVRHNLKIEDTAMKK